jgi:hypothetical protein
LKFRITLFFFALILLTVLIPQNAHAQTCPDLVQEAYDTTQAVCAALGSDEACYGNIAIDAEPDTLEFNESGDLVSVDQIEGLRLSSMNVDAQEWGISLIHVVVLSGNDELQTNWCCLAMWRSKIRQRTTTPMRRCRPSRFALVWRIVPAKQHRTAAC